MTGAILIGSLVLCFVNLMKSLSGRDWNGVITQAVSWVAGIGAVLLVVHSGLADATPVLSTTVGHLNGWGQVVAGLLASSLFGVVHNLTQAIDQTDTAKTPQLVPPASPTPPAA